MAASRLAVNFLKMSVDAPTHCISANIKKSDYRPDIDGLRAIAVLSVVVYHAFPSLAPGGFVGVDIFFVISGYLISKHIFSDLSTDTFSIKAFYARRIKRIFPALSLVLVACGMLGYVILTPGEYKQLGKHIAGGAGFVSNIIYWKESGYFDTVAATKPLLHLWSLGVEEQFYIAWPLMLALLWRKTRHLGLALLCVLCLSLAYSIVVVGHDVTADFYSPLTRFWELVLGAGLAYGVAHKPYSEVTHPSLFSWFGLCLILVAVIALRSTDHFPGTWALLPSIGAACLIYAGPGSWLNRHVLSSRPLVWLGLISYPLYLWHWPLLSFAQIITSETPTVGVRFWLVVSSVVLAWLTYRLVEFPIRVKLGPQSKNIVWLLSLIMFILCVAGLSIIKFDGLKSRHLSLLNGDVSTLSLGIDRDRLQDECGLSEAQKDLFEYCLRDSREAPRLVALGDSKADALFDGLVRESKPNMRWILINSVRPPEHEAAPEDRQQIKNRLAFQIVTDNPSIKVVALVVALRDIFPVDNESGFIKGDIATTVAKRIADYSQTIQKLEQVGKRVVFVIDNPTLPDPRSCISGGMTSSPMLNQFLRRKQNPHCTIRYTDHLAGTNAYRKFVAELGRLNPGLIIYDPTPLLCNISQNICTITREGKFLYSYSDHISDYANSIIARDMFPLIQELAH
jgi:peptidoglycan/LPS O-acetylase OafA/YrhL